MGLQEQTFTMLILQAFSYITGGKRSIIASNDKHVWPKLCLSIRTDGYVQWSSNIPEWKRSWYFNGIRLGVLKRNTKISLSWLRACLVTNCW